MCNAKPGNRCSPHAREEIISINKQIAAKQAELDEWNEEIDKVRAANPNDDDAYYYGHFEYSMLSDAKENLLRKKQEAELVYNATPDGIKSLERLTAVSGNAVINRTFSPWEYYDMGYYEDDDLTEEIEVSIPLKRINEAKLQEGINQKKWQSDTLKILKENEAIAPEKAVFIAEAINADIDKQIREIQSKSGELYKKQSSAIYAQTKHIKLEENPVTLAKAELALEKNKLRISYLALRQKDLKSYIANTKKKIVIPELVKS